MRKFFTLLVMLMSIGVMMAANKVDSTILTHNYTYNGTSCMKVTVNFQTEGENHVFRPIVFVFDNQGETYHRDTNGKYATDKGCVCAPGADVIAPYANSTVTGSEIYLPNSEIHPYPGTHTYYVKVFILDVTTGAYVCCGDFVPFDMTGK